MPNQGSTQAGHDPIMAEIGGFPFFADSFQYDREMETDTYHSKSSLGAHTVVTGQSITGSIQLGGHFIAEEIQPIIRANNGVPKPNEIKVTMLESRERYTFEDAICSNDNEMQAKMTKIGDPIDLDFVAMDVECEIPA